MSRTESMWMLGLAAATGLLGGLVGGMATGGSAGAQDTPAAHKVISAEEFRLVSRDGKVHAQFAAHPDGAASLVFYDSGGKIRAEMGVNAAGVSEVALYDQGGKQRQSDGFAYLFVLPNGGPRLSLVGDAANLTIASPQLAAHATLKVEPDHNPVLSLEGHGKGSALLTMLQDGNPSFVLYDAEGYRRAMLEVSELGAKGKGPARSALLLLDKNEKLIWSAP